MQNEYKNVGTKDLKQQHYCHLVEKEDTQTTLERLFITFEFYMASKILLVN